MKNGDFTFSAAGIPQEDNDKYFGLVYPVNNIDWVDVAGTTQPYLKLKDWETGGSTPGLGPGTASGTYASWGAQVSASTSADWPFIAQPEGASPSMVYFGEISTIHTYTHIPDPF